MVPVNPTGQPSRASDTNLNVAAISAERGAIGPGGGGNRRNSIFIVGTQEVVTIGQGGGNAVGIRIGSRAQINGGASAGDNVACSILLEGGDAINKRQVTVVVVHIGYEREIHIRHIGAAHGQRLDHRGSAGCVDRGDRGIIGGRGGER